MASPKHLNPSLILDVKPTPITGRVLQELLGTEVAKLLFVNAVFKPQVLQNIVILSSSSVVVVAVAVIVFVVVVFAVALGLVVAINDLSLGRKIGERRPS